MLKKGEAGIGTLILFIALILVAAITASVLIQTSSSLQSKALATGSEARKQVSTGIVIMEAWGEDASSTKQIDRIHFTVRLSAGSEPIQLNQSYVAFWTDGSRQTYQFNTTGNCSNTSAINAAGITYLISPYSHYNSPGYLMDGDILDICFLAIAPVGQAEKVTLAFVPKTGSPYSFTTQTPSAMFEKRVSLFPN